MHMKRSFSLPCIAACLLIFLLPAANAYWVCNGTTRPTVTPAEPPGPYGSITVESSPNGAVITINGEDEGRAPVTISNLWPGTYTITARMNGYETYTGTTTISGRTRSLVYCPLVPANSTSGLSVTSLPAGANVYLDGAYRGISPLTLGDPASGTHIIQIRLEGYGEWKSTIEINDKRTYTVSATLNPDAKSLSGAINISSEPAGAAVRFDGLARGISPITLEEIAPGIHIVQLSLIGYDEWKSTVDIIRGQTKNLSVTLVPESAGSTGSITVTSAPGGALVMIDGNMAGRIPANSSLQRSMLAPGYHTVALELSGYRPYSTRTNVVAGRISEVSAVLEPAGKGTLVITSNPAGAEIFIDNSPAGLSPVTLSDVEEGDHAITLKLDGYEEYSTGIQVSGGNESRISADLLPRTTKALYSPPAETTLLAALLIAGLFVPGRYR